MKNASKPIRNDNSAIENQPETTKQSNHRRRTWIIAGALSIIAVVILLGYSPVMKKINHRRSEAFKQQCKSATSISDWENLKVISEQWMKSSPQNNDALLFAAEACVQLDQLERVVELLGKVDNSYQGILPALEGRGDILFSDLNLSLDAEENWKRMLTIDEKSAIAHQRLIYFYAMTLQRQKMVKQIQLAMKLTCEPPEAYSYLIMQNVLNFSDGLAMLTRWRSKYPENESLEVAQAVYSAKQTADNGMATFGIQTVSPGDKTLLNKTLKKYPSNLELLALKIDLAIFEGDTNAVVKLLTKASSDAENDSRFWRYRGWLLKKRGEYSPAAQSLEHAIKLNAFEWQSRLLLADAYRHLNMPEKSDKQSVIASQGKELQRKLFESPTARDVNAELIDNIYEYLLLLDAPEALAALQQRR
ncbi:MAG: hypothetical protein JKY95_15845 [Planctomycetaceae bacterium]|nr:hypothetical protein [Planctomycetaceae bacterium]